MNGLQKTAAIASIAGAAFGASIPVLARAATEGSESARLIAVESEIAKSRADHDVIVETRAAVRTLDHRLDAIEKKLEAALEKR